MEKSRLAVVLVLVGTALAVLGDLLLREFPWGANVSLWSLVLLTVTVLLARMSRAGLVRGWGWVALPVALLSFCFLWRDSTSLLLLNVVAVGAGLAFIYSRIAGADLRAAGIAAYCQSLLLSVINSSAGALVLVVNDIPWRSLAEQRSRGTFLPSLRGLLLALPIGLLFLSLFMSADAAFDTLIRTVFDIDIAALLEHSVVIGFLSWAVIGFLRARLMDHELVEMKHNEQRAISLGAHETVIVLVTINAIFLAFIVVQAGYFFGGTDFIRQSAGITYAEYARRGFFELVGAAGLSLLTLLAADWALGKEEKRNIVIYRILSAVQMLLVLVVMGSAVHRLALYQAAFGLTESRVYAMGCLFWLLLVFVWFGWTVLRGRRERFAFGALLAAFLVLLVLNAMNPERVIATVNVARAAEGRPFDVRYATSLSDDAVPVLVDALPHLTPADRSVLAQHLLCRFTKEQPADLRSWNNARRAAMQALSSHQRELRNAAVNLVEAAR